MQERPYVASKSKIILGDALARKPDGLRNGVWDDTRIQEEFFFLQNWRYEWHKHGPLHDALRRCRDRHYGKPEWVL